MKYLKRTKSQVKSNRQEPLIQSLKLTFQIRMKAYPSNAGFQLLIN